MSYEYRHANVQDIYETKNIDWITKKTKHQSLIYVEPTTSFYKKEHKYGTSSNCSVSIDFRWILMWSR